MNSFIDNEKKSQIYNKLVNLCAWTSLFAANKNLLDATEFHHWYEWLNTKFEKWEFIFNKFGKHFVDLKTKHLLCYMKSCIYNI